MSTRMACIDASAVVLGYGMDDWNDARLVLAVARAGGLVAAAKASEGGPLDGVPALGRAGSPAWPVVRARSGRGLPPNRRRGARGAGGRADGGGDAWPGARPCRAGRPPDRAAARDLLGNPGLPVAHVLCRPVPLGAPRHCGGAGGGRADAEPVPAGSGRGVAGIPPA